MVDQEISEAESPVRPTLNKWTRIAKIRPAILLWALGVPIPIILLFMLIRGC